MPNIQPAAMEEHQDMAQEGQDDQSFYSYSDILGLSTEPMKHNLPPGACDHTDCDDDNHKYWLFVV